MRTFLIQTFIRTLLALTLMVSHAHASLFSPQGSVESLRKRYSITRTSATPKSSLPLNATCTKGFLTGVQFYGVRRFPDLVNFCEVDEKRIPAEILATLEKMAELNKKIAATLGESAKALFSMGLDVYLVGHERGALGSEVSGMGLSMTVLPDWKLADFSSMVYVHEVVHVLTFNSGPFADALVGLEEHPFLIEALPDLVSAVVHESPVITVADPGLPSCIRDFRDGTPIQSLGQKFGSFYRLSPVDQVIACCDGLKDANPSTRRLCGLITAEKPLTLGALEGMKLVEALDFMAFVPENLNLPFEPSQCIVKGPSGLVSLENCDTHQFGKVLVSFFFRLKELTGSHQLLGFLSQLKASAPATPQFECGYTDSTPSLGGAKARFKIRPLLGPLMALRASLGDSGMKAFDQAWAEHEMAKFVDLDRLYRNEVFLRMAQVRVQSRNEIYTSMNSCDSLYRFGSDHCRVSCKKTLEFDR